MVPYGAHKKMYYPILSPELVAMFKQRARYKFCNLTSFMRQLRKIKNINNISLKFTMLTDNNQIFRNRFVIIHRHFTKVSAQIVSCIIFKRNELSITLSTLCWNPLFHGADTQQARTHCRPNAQSILQHIGLKPVFTTLKGREHHHGITNECVLVQKNNYRKSQEAKNFH